MNPTHGIANKEVFVYVEKAPYVSSGLGDHGVIRYDKERDSVMCNECGEWFKGLGMHVRMAHNLSGADYRARHGLRRTTPLCTPSESERLRQRKLRELMIPGRREMAIEQILLVQPRGAQSPRGTWGRNIERRNVQSDCAAQLVSQFMTMRENLGRSPSLEEFAAFRGAARTTTESVIRGAHDKTWNQFQEALGFVPYVVRGDCVVYSTEYLIETLRDFYVSHGRLPRSREGVSGISKSTYRARFGSWREACYRAGFGIVFEQNMARAGRLGRPKNRPKIETEQMHGVGA